MHTRCGMKMSLCRSSKRYHGASSLRVFFSIFLVSSQPATYLSELDASWNPLAIDGNVRAEFLVDLLSPTSTDYLGLSCLRTLHLRGSLATRGKRRPCLFVWRQSQGCWMVNSFEKGADSSCNFTSGDQFVFSLAELLDLVSVASSNLVCILPYLRFCSLV